ncbi:hypothetical protein C5E45_06090 [Nocardia nova]|uniref:Protein kinase n=2 Tax=Nocardia nova TaxID=37330 RepID=A0A2S6AV26_9NOCA|nr:hypothetical protein C5E41_04635 [Nocardia nova]PPJ39060.1 hypothetical protein C5E45_06090 [Nocardia nova]
MKVMSAITGWAVAAGAAVCWATGTASATAVHCDTDRNRDITIVAGNTACRAVGDDSGHARSAGIDGVGYAKATAGALALGLGAGGGIGASEGAAGLPVAVGMGPGAFAFTSLAPEDVPGRIGLSFAMNGSQAQVVSGERGTVCLGSAALAWDSRTGALCLATPIGLWQVPAAH